MYYLNSHNLSRYKTDSRAEMNPITETKGKICMKPCITMYIEKAVNLI